MKEKPKVFTKDILKEHQDETDAKVEFAKKVALSKLKNEPIIPDEQWSVLQDKILKRRLKEKEMKDALKDVK